MSAPSRSTLYRGDCLLGRDCEQPHHSAHTMFPKLTIHNSDTCIPTHPGQDSISHTTSCNSFSCFAYDSILSVMPSRQILIHPPESESTFCVDAPSQILSSTKKSETVLSISRQDENRALHSRAGHCQL